MPGICGYLNFAPQPESAGLADRMLSRLGSRAYPIVGRHVDAQGRFALGRVSLGVLPTAPQPAASADGRWQAALDGELYDTDKLCSELQRQGLPAKKEDHAATFLATIATNGFSAVAALEGSFAAAIVDVREQTVSIISDRFGTRPIYYARTPNRFLFGSSIACLLADPEISRDFDWQGISQFFTFGHYFNDNTSLSAVKLLPSAAILEFDARANKLTLQRYWSGSERVGRSPATRQEACEAVDEALVASVRKRQTSDDARLGISLSGGLDARTILGTLDHRQSNLATVCMGMEGSQDHKASTELARLVGCQHYNHILDTAFLGEFGRHLENMVRLTDGQYLSQCIVMPTLPVYQRLGIGVLMRGHAGELLHMSKAYNYSLDTEALNLRTDAALEEWLWRRLKAYIQDGVDGPLFASRELDSLQVARKSLGQALADTPHGESPAGRVAHLFLDQRVRRETMLSMMKFRSVSEPRLPYLDRLLVERLLATPVEWRMGDEIQTYILQKHQPRFCQVANTNTGAALGAGRARRAYTGLKSRILGKLGVRGYQPYERLGLWLRRDLAALVKATLLSEASLGRGIFHPDTVHSVVERHLSGQRNHTYLIMAMMIFEVGHRWLLDDQSSGDEAPDRRLQSAAH
jgi:asparagine synthase (glutamine-hydrolysing)